MTRTVARRSTPPQVSRSSSASRQDLRNEFARRRRALLKIMGRDSIAIVPSAPVRHRNNDVEYAYRQDSDFY
ncbi:MAG TPA: aminopeptidase P N-terminal domain-containing protein, partial [Steroidobacteraceae bacterium]|nr:aminopeptidase P N-terminal domain-containing protein [Steroidobacteraceae bacterium]